MKNEIFDEVLKQKIERQNLLATEQEIDRVHKHVRQNFSGKSSSWIQWIAASVALAMVSSLVVWTVEQRAANEKLILAVNEMQTELLKSNQMVVQNEIENKNEIQQIQRESQLQINQLKSELNRFGVDKNYNIESNTTYSSQITRIGLKNKNAQNVTILNNQTVGQNKIGKSIVPQNQHKSNSNLASNADAVEIGSKENVQKLNQPEHELDTNKSYRIANVGVDTFKKISAITKTENDTLEIEKASVPKMKPFDFVKTWKYRLGINGEFAHEQMGVGLFGELLLNRHWSVAAGLKKGMITSDHFKDDKDYYFRKSRDFRSEYASSYSSATDISNIDFQYALLQLPLSINYRFLLKNNLNFVGSLGTDIDLSVRQMVKYESKFNTEMPKTNSTESVRKGMILNNGILSLGVEAHLKQHFVAQVSPYLLANYKLNEYRNERFAAGLRFRLSYQF
jgi:hypothetical protein